MALKKHIIRNDVHKLIGKIKLVGSDQYTLNHLADLLHSREQHTLADSYRKMYEIETRWDSIRNFYYWCKDHHFSSIDMLVAELYVAVARKHRCNVVKVSAFAGRSEILVDRIQDWSGDCGNGIDELLKDYFEAGISSALSFCSTIVSSPKSLLEDFGWNAFEKWVEEIGGKSTYLRLSDSAAHSAKTERDCLVDIARSRKQAIESSDINTYDKIGEDISFLGILKTHEKWCGKR